MNRDKDLGNLTYFPGQRWREKRSAADPDDRGPGRDQTTPAERDTDAGEILLKTLEKPFESAGRSRRIALLRKKIREGRYHVPALELAERLISGESY